MCLSFPMCSHYMRLIYEALPVSHLLQNIYKIFIIYDRTWCDLSTVGPCLRHRKLCAVAHSPDCTFCSCWGEKLSLSTSRYSRYFFLTDLPMCFSPQWLGNDGGVLDLPFGHLFKELWSWSVSRALCTSVPQNPPLLWSSLLWSSLSILRQSSVTLHLNYRVIAYLNTLVNM